MAKIFSFEQRIDKDSLTINKHLKTISLFIIIPVATLVWFNRTH